MKTCRKPRTSLLLVLGLALACLFGGEPGPVHAGTLTVDTAADEQDNHCDDGDCSLRDAIKIAAAGDTVVFDSALSGQTITLTIGQLDIDRDLTLDGSDLASHVEISGNKTFRVFAIHGSVVVTLRSLDIMNGKTPGDGVGGGGIYNESNLTVTGCNVTHNVTTDRGGGIHNFGELTVNGGSVVASNSGDYGGGIRNDNGTMTITDSTISDNTGNWGGGIDNYAGSMTLDNATLERNVANHNGGGITTSATATIEDSSFTDNNAERGGGIENHETGVILTLTNCTFTGNTSYWDGGALLNDAATAEISGTTFGSNSAGVSGAGSGGAINNASAMTLTDCRLDANTAPDEGGGIYNNDTGTLTMNSSALTGNTASGTATGWGGGISNYGVLTLNGGSLSGNTAHLHGGGIWNWDGDLTINGVSFATNSAEDNGGAIVNNWNGSLSAARSTFASNTADSGAAILNDNGSTMTLENCTLSANSALYDGGGLDNFSGTVTIANSTFDGNSATTGGGINNHAQGNFNYRNTIIANSPSGGDCVNAGTIGDHINNLAGDGGCLAALSDDPGLAPLADNGGPTETHALLPGSPAIDAGDDTTCLATDQRGAARPADGDASGTTGCDIGAFELGGLKCGIQTAGEPADYAFLDDVNLQVTADGTNLNCLRVTGIPFNHPYAAAPLQTGKYWQIGALRSDHSTAATADYLVDLTLPYNAAGADNRVCRWTDSDWDCAVTGYVANTSVTRAGIPELSDWTVGKGDCGEAVMPDPDISHAGTQKRDVLLSWADDPTNAGGYQVHRSASPYFTPGAGTLRATRPAGSTSYTDTGAARTAGVHYSYIVRGLSNCGAPSDYDRRLGVFNFGLTPGQ